MSWLWNKSPEFEEFSHNYARARQHQVEKWSDEIIDISDGQRGQREEVRRSELRVSTRKWIMSKRACKKWGDKVEENGDSAGDKLDALIEVLKAGPAKRNTNGA